MNRKSQTANPGAIQKSSNGAAWKWHIINILALIITLGHSVPAAAQSSKNVKLHVNPKWKECSFQLDPSLTQKAWHQFTQEAGLVTYFRSLTDARPMGGRNYELSVLQWQTKFDDTDEAWNNTFVHPDSNHWLKEDDRLAFPGLMFRMGLTDKIDIGAYWTKSPGANYGFYGGQVQYNVINNIKNRWAGSIRGSFVSLYGPKDLDLTVYGLDFIASRELNIHSSWISVSPYAEVSSYLSSSHEKTTAVDLKDENILGLQGAVGVVGQISKARLAVEYSVAKVSSLSFKVGVAF